MTPDERARSLLLPILDGTEVLVPPHIVPDEEPYDAGSVGTDTVPSPIAYPEDPTDGLVILDDSSWSLLHETSKLVSNTSSFSLLSTWMGSSLPMTRTLFRLPCLCSQVARRNFDNKFSI